MGQLQRLFMQQVAVADAWAIAKEAERQAKEKAAAAAAGVVASTWGFGFHMKQNMLSCVWGGLTAGHKCRPPAWLLSSPWRRLCTLDGCHMGCARMLWPGVVPDISLLANAHMQVAPLPHSPAALLPLQQHPRRAPLPPPRLRPALRLRRQRTAARWRVTELRTWRALTWTSWPLKLPLRPRGMRM